MKKGLLFFTFAAVMLMVSGCSKEKKWGEKEREELRNELRAYRDMIYLDNLVEAEYEDFAGDVIEAVEVDYPIYTTFIELPARGDTLDVYVVSTIVERLDTNPHNMRNLYPYPWLVAEGILPSGLNNQAQRAFYDCLSHKVKRHYRSTKHLLHALMDDPAAQDVITKMQMECAADLFDWGVEVDETVVVETQS